MAQDLKGMKFGRLTAISRAENTKQNRAQWLCVCDCGNKKIAQAAYLKKGTTRSCGCLANEQRKKAAQSQCHPYSRTERYRERKSWENMIARCYNPKSPDFKRYGGRGITVCDRWRESFEAFVVDMGARPDNATIDRVDNNGNYTLENCRWATRVAQVNNRRDNRIIALNGIERTVAQWSEQTSLSHTCITHRLNSGWSAEKALTTPIKGI